MILVLLRLVIAAALLYAVYQGYLILKDGARRGKLRRIAANRGDMSGYPHFQVLFSDWPSEKLRFVYDDLSGRIDVENFPLLPDDRLEDLGLEGKVLDEALHDIVGKYGGNYEQAQKNLEAQPLQTARDVVNWIGLATQTGQVQNGSL